MTMCIFYLSLNTYKVRIRNPFFFSVESEDRRNGKSQIYKTHIVKHNINVYKQKTNINNFSLFFILFECWVMPFTGNGEWKILEWNKKTKDIFSVWQNITHSKVIDFLGFAFNYLPLIQCFFGEKFIISCCEWLRQIQPCMLHNLNRWHENE